MLLPNLKLICDADLYTRMSFNIQSVVAVIEVPVQHTEVAEDLPASH